jgi:hypothetical protein
MNVFRKQQNCPAKLKFECATNLEASSECIADQILCQAFESPKIRCQRDNQEDRHYGKNA